MSNKFKGEASIEVEGVTYTLRCDFNALCHFEEATGKDPIETFEAFETGKVSTKVMRHMMHAFLQEHHEDADLKLAGSLLSEDATVLMRVVENATPDAKGAKEPGKKRAAK